MENQQMAGGSQMNFSLADTRNVTCECGNGIFMDGYRFQKASRILTGGVKDAIIPIPLYLCTQCSKPLQELLPEELKEKKITD
jgi:DNA-directed RNA polymerase subunit RPC12/RpoP